MTDPTRPLPGPAASTASEPGRSRPGLVLLADLDPPTGVALAEQLAARGADLVHLESGSADAAGSRLAAALVDLVRRTGLAPAEREADVDSARALLAARERAGGTPLVLAGRSVAEALPFFVRVAGGPERATVVLVGNRLTPSATEPPATAGRRLAAAERRWRRALGAVEGAAVYVLAGEPGPDDLAGLGAFLGLDAAGGRGGGQRPTRRAPDPAADEAGLQALLAGVAGPHRRFASPPLPPESALSAAVTELEAEAGELAAALAWTAQQLEPLLGVEVEDPWAGDRPSSVELAGGAGGDPTAGPYPLNASEDREAYHDWLRERRLPVRLATGGAPGRAATTVPGNQAVPVVSVVVPVYRTPLWALERCVGSVLAQDAPGWQLCLCDDASGDAELSARLEDLARRDPRIALTALPASGGISAATNAALALARGELVAFLDHDDELAPHAVRRLAEALEHEPDADVIYSDEDKIDATGERFDPFFKPDWSPDLLLSYAYLAHLTAVRRRLVEELGGLRSAFDGSQDWDLALRATERARRVVHVPDVLYHWRSLPGSASSGASAKPWAFEAGTRVLEDALARRGGGEVEQSTRFPGRYHVRRAIPGQPLVSAVIPFRDEPALLATCATSMRAAPGYDRFELVLVDNGSELPETAELLDRLRGEPNIRIVEAPGPFNWAAINNAAAREAAGDLLLFSNNDIEARVPRWLHAMVGHAVRPEVGAVGARLLYPDGTIQHAGVVIGLGGIAGHVLRGLPADRPGYASMAIQTRNCSVVTGACMMVRREVFESAGGFDERLPVAFNDVDFCLRLREQGYLLVYEPLAELVHHESRSRGHTDDLAEGKRIVERWTGAIAAGDPYLNANLSHWRYWCPLSTAQEDYRWKTYLETPMSTPRSSSTT